MSQQQINQIRRFFLTAQTPDSVITQMNDVIVLIPIYRNFLEDYEKISLHFNLMYLEQYPKKFVAPIRLKNDRLFKDILDIYNFEAVFFEDSFFKNIGGYNKLMMNLNFYRKFDNYNFMLICQLDALVFSNNLQYWIDKNYDYIGAPWVVEHEETILLDSMGNGGLSLRKIGKFIEVLESHSFHYSDKKFILTSTRAGIRNLFLIKLFNKLQKTGLKINFLRCYLHLYRSNEDYFWAFIAQYFVGEFVLASPTEALKFAFEVNPKKCYEANAYQLPFGCHAWQKYEIDFWKQQLPEIKTEF